MRALVLLLLLPTVSGCSLLWHPYGELQMADGHIVTTGTSDGIILDLETGQSRDLDLGYFARAFINPEASHYVTYHQEGLGADCSGRTYAGLYEVDGTVVEEWEEPGRVYGWEDGFFLDGDRDWQGNKVSGPSRDVRWDTAVSGDGQTWAWHDYGTDSIHVVSESQVIQYPTERHFQVALNHDGSIVAGADVIHDEDVFLQVIVRSQDGPNWNWTLPIEGDYPIASIAVSENKVSVAADQGFLLDLADGSAKRLNTNLKVQSTDIYEEAGWMLTDADGHNVHFVTETQAWRQLLDNQWVQPNHPGWKTAPSAQGAQNDGITEGKDAPTPFGVVLIGLALLRRRA